MKPIEIIAAIRIGIINAEHRFKNGGCFQLYRVLKQLFPQAVPWEYEGHVYTEIDGIYYDIDGGVTQLGVRADRLDLMPMQYAKAHDLDFERGGVMSNFQIAGHWEIFKSPTGKFQAKLKAGNGQVIAVTDGHEAKQSVYKSIESIRRNVNGEIEDLT